MSIQSILETKGAELITVLPGDSLRKVAKLFKKKRIGFALVQNSDRATLGSVSERDIVQAMAELGDVVGLPVADVMNANVVVCDIGDTTDVVRDLMTTKRTRHVVVMDGAKAVGLVSIGDLIKHSLSECQLDTGLMRAYISGQGYQ